MIQNMFLILVVFSLILVHFRKEEFIEIFHQYRPSWFPPCDFCLGFWTGVLYATLTALCIL